LGCILIHCQHIHRGKEQSPSINQAIKQASNHLATAENAKQNKKIFKTFH